LQVRLGACPRGEHLKSKHCLIFEIHAREKYSSLFGLFISYEEKSFVTATPRPNVKKLFTYVKDACNKLGCLLFKPSPMFASKAEAYPFGAHFRF
jgi:hypothetical protein